MTTQGETLRKRVHKITLRTSSLRSVLIVINVLGLKGRDVTTQGETLRKRVHNITLRTFSLRSVLIVNYV